MRRKILPMLAAAALGVTLSASAAAQTPNDDGPDTVSGTATSSIGTITVDAQKPAGGPASGEFVADATLAPFSAGGERLGGRDLPFFGSLPAVHFEGPVTCLNVQGNRAGLIYPIDEADPRFFEGQAVLITIQDNGPGEADTVGFYGPAPIERFDSCPASLPTFLTVLEGDLIVNDR